MQGLRFAQKREAFMPRVLAINYICATVLSITYSIWVSSGAISINLIGILLAATNGILFFGAVLIILASYRIAGTGITAAVVNSALILPVLVAHALWPQEEPMTAWRWIALSLIPVTMFLIRPTEISTAHYRLTLKADLLLLVLFLSQGMINVLHKVATKHLEPESQDEYLTVIFFAAALGSAIYAFCQEKRPSSQDVIDGVIIGICNAMAVGMSLGAIMTIGAVIFFATSGPVAIVLNIVISLWLWRERITVRQGVGVTAAILVVILTNL